MGASLHSVSHIHVLCPISMSHVPRPVSQAPSSCIPSCRGCERSLALRGSSCPAPKQRQKIACSLQAASPKPKDFTWK